MDKRKVKDILLLADKLVNKKTFDDIFVETHKNVEESKKIRFKSFKSGLKGEFQGLKTEILSGFDSFSRQNRKSIKNTKSLGESIIDVIDKRMISLSKSFNELKTSSKSFNDKPREVIIKNQLKPPIQKDTFNISRSKWISKGFVDIIKSIYDVGISIKGSILRVEVVNKNPRNAIAVRFTDKDAKRFSSITSQSIISGSYGSNSVFTPSTTNNGTLTTLISTPIPITASNVNVKTILIQAKSTNIGVIKIGDKISQNIELFSKSSMTVDISKSTTLYFSVSIDNEGINYLIVN